MRNVLALLLLLAGCATSGFPPASNPPPRADAPQIHVGDTWVYRATDAYTGLDRGGYQHTVVAIDHNTATVRVARLDRSAEVEQRYTLDWNWHLREMTNLQPFRFDPPYPAFQFPLQPGKSWQASVAATDPVTGRTNRVRVDADVIGWERVTVPAGAFDAIHVRRLVYAGNYEYFRGQEQIAEHDWYVPALNGVVRRETNSGYCDLTQVRMCWRRNDWTVAELVEYRPARR